MTGTELDVSVVVVTWNSSSVVGRFLSSVQPALDDLDYEVLVVDNASTDGTADLVRAVEPEARVIEMGVNAGYAAAINAGIRVAAPARSLLVCNPDVVLWPSSVARMARELRDPRVGIVAPKHLDARGHLVPSLRRRPTVLRALGEAVLGGRLAGRFHRLGEMIHDPATYDRSTDVDWASGAVLLLSRPCVEAVGRWDERFFLYSEETDYALRAADAGYRVRFVPEATIEHGGGELHRSPALWRLQAVNRVRLYRLRHGRLGGAAFWLAVVLNEGIRAASGRARHRAALEALVRPTMWTEVL